MLDDFDQMVDKRNQAGENEEEKQKIIDATEWEEYALEPKI